MNLFSYLVCCISLSLRVSAAASVLGNETDRLALLAFKSQITLDPFKVLKSWNDSNHFCDWEGVYCIRKPTRVRALALEHMRLVGSISPHIGNLSFLEGISLRDNNFQNEIPQELGKLFRLEHLYLDNNSFVGNIPSSLALCSNLKNLWLHNNNLVGKIPMELGFLPKLVNLSLFQNKLTGDIPPSLGNLSSLEILQLNGNSLEGSIPSSLSHLKRLKTLSLGVNNLSGMFPLPLYNLSTLETFFTAENRLTGYLPAEIGFLLPNIRGIFIGINQYNGQIPISLFNASKLIQIDLSDNHFTGKVPSTVGNLRNLRLLNLEINELGGGNSGDLDFFTSLTNCTNLQLFSINSNRFRGRLPASIANFSNQLTRLQLSQNRFFGEIPNSIGNLPNLIVLTMSFNFFTGSIPMGLGNLQKLQALYLGKNRLSGQVPSFLRNISQLFYLSLAYNNLEGSISNALANQNLQMLDLSYNNFTGSIPKEIAQSSQLNQLELSQNLLNGSIPLEIGNLKNLLDFKLSENKFTGEIPSTIGSCSSLQNLSLDGNFFQGTLPVSLNALKDLSSLAVSRNNLSGSIPKELGNLTVLTLLNLSFNNFEGEVPIEGIFQNVSAFSLFGNHKLCGGIAKLGLPKCHNQRSKKQGNRLALKVSLGVLVPSFMVALLLVICLRKKSQAKSQATPPNETCLVDLKTVSYNDLHKATDGFCSTNLIGMGSYGSVYKGIVHQDESPFAVKVFNLMEHGASKTFMAECEALKVIRHRNLLKIITVCSGVDFDGKDFKALVYKFMPNGSLESWLHPSSDLEHLRKSLNFYQKLDIAIDVASALDYLHNHCEISTNTWERNIVHCDLKSSNILLDDDLTAHIGDFGLAKFLSKNASSSTSNKSEADSIAIRGTIGYIPPEYGMGAKVSTEGDVYSYGILLLEMFTGKRPTDPMFNDGLSIRDFSRGASRQGVMDITDKHMLFEQTHDKDVNSTNLVKESLSLILGIGIACSMDIPTQRIGIKDVLKELHSIKRNVFKYDSMRKDAVFTVPYSKV